MPSRALIILCVLSLNILAALANLRGQELTANEDHEDERLLLSPLQYCIVANAPGSAINTILLLLFWILCIPQWIIGIFTPTP